MKENKIAIIKEILAIPETAAYYWKLVFTTAFQELKHKKGGKAYSLREAANEADVPYHNMKKMFLGRGNTEMSYRFLLFFYTNEIDIQAIRLRMKIVCEAYNNYLNFLRNRLE